jgi:hypothetical protein
VEKVTTAHMVTGGENRGRVAPLHAGMRG